MPRTYRLLWFQRDGYGYWYKYFKDSDGKTYKKYFGRGKSRTNDNESYRQAIATYNVFLNSGTVIADNPTPLVKPRRSSRTTSWRPKATLEGVFDRWISRSLKNAKNQSRKPRLSNRINAFKHFINWTRGCKHSFSSPKVDYHTYAALTTTKIVRYADHLRELIHRGELNHHTARHYIINMRALGRWANANHFFSFTDNPQDLKMSYPDNKDLIEYWDIPTLSKIWNVSPPRLQLWILLALNTSYTQADLATLTIGEIEFNGSKPVRIMRHRTKTGNIGSFLLWDKTSKLLTQWIESQRLTGPDQYLFRTSRGNLLVRTRIIEKVNADNRLVRSESHCDGIGRSFGTHKKLAGVNSPLSFRHLRKTSATYLSKILTDDANPNAVLIEQLLLSHTPQHMSRQRYVAIDRSLLDEPLSRMESLFSPIWED